ncbi:Kunitz/Bovine pancreatic trypsin inhibitor domain protein [Necator americanus]|uniref:Kunitz/Bovine pancreatic trypsin inhibitor domain protein n=1 Tax=Necator americanus TaxID=51031 RepID=W2TFG4_NECAM|nr:Kunitz/Bovine pancreatic trypsin inhibitor domain protein [Necator americanus]ETN80324.1 Kunitz/Bovine pancreatic trypsin inhibitor domain protein [Necator americanus]
MEHKILLPATRPNSRRDDGEVEDVKQQVVKWAWNPVEERCEPFYYGGCGGNGNRFETQQKCLDECWNNHVDEEHKKKPEPRCIKYIV